LELHFGYDLWKQKHFQALNTKVLITVTAAPLAAISIGICSVNKAIYSVFSSASLNEPVALKSGYLPIL
jgi:hypothetical protein